MKAVQFDQIAWKGGQRGHVDIVTDQDGVEAVNQVFRGEQESPPQGPKADPFQQIHCQVERRDLKGGGIDRGAVQTGSGVLLYTRGSKPCILVTW